MIVSAKFLKYYKYMIIEVIGLIVLGAFVRAMDAGLACPDWPLCFGDIIPDFQLQVYLEFLHRALAGIIAIACFVLHIKLIRNKKVSDSIKNICIFSLTILMAQIIMGGLTVTLQLDSYVVATHLMLAMFFLLTLLWIYYYISDTKKIKTLAITKTLSLVSFFVILIQILIGGLVASHYAALVCTDFPLCQGKFLPTFSGIVGLQVIHRLWAYVVTIVLIGFGIHILKNKKALSEISTQAKLLIVFIVIQVIIGISNIIFHTPPLLTITHSLFAVLLLMTSWNIYYKVK